MKIERTNEGRNFLKHFKFHFFKQCQIINIFESLNFLFIMTRMRITVMRVGFWTLDPYWNGWFEQTRFTRIIY